MSEPSEDADSGGEWPDIMAGGDYNKTGHFVDFIQRVRPAVLKIDWSSSETDVAVTALEKLIERDAFPDPDKLRRASRVGLPLWNWVLTAYEFAKRVKAGGSDCPFATLAAALENSQSGSGTGTVATTTPDGPESPAEGVWMTVTKAFKAADDAVMGQDPEHALRKSDYDEIKAFAKLPAAMEAVGDCLKILRVTGEVRSKRQGQASTATGTC